MKNWNNILTPNTNDAAIHKYPELNGEDLRVQPALFKNKHKVNTIVDAVQALNEMPPEVRGLFDQEDTCEVADGGARIVCRG